MNDDAIVQKIGSIMTHLTQNQRLQNLARENGLDVRNTTQLTDDTVNNVAVSCAALMLASRENDPDYEALKRAGLGHRSLKVGLINKYKDQANQLINQYKSSLRDGLSSE